MSAWKKDKGGRWATEAQEQEYWLSYSDLMAGLLMIFALMLFAALHHYGGLINEAGEIASTQSDIIIKLDSIMKTDSSGITVDPRTGVVNFPDGVLFDEGKAELSSAGRATLNRFGELYFGVLLGDPAVRAELRSIVIEGHTNDNASYMFNLDLSQRRAFTVMRHFLENMPEYEADLKAFVSASGRSFSELIYCDPAVEYAYHCPPGESDKIRSRRIEILFRLKHDEYLERIRDRLLVQGRS